MQLKITSDDDPRWNYLYDSWSVLLTGLPPVAEGIRDAIYKLVSYGFEHINSLHTEVVESREAKSQSRPVCTYEKMIKAIRLAASLAINQKGTPIPGNESIIQVTLNNLGNLMDEHLRVAGKLEIMLSCGSSSKSDPGHPDSSRGSRLSPERHRQPPDCSLPQNFHVYTDC